MERPTVAYLFELPSMVNGFLLAGNAGVQREIDRIDILESPYPEVEVFLEQNEFIFTSFWNSKDDKPARIGLVRSMIRHKCAGIAIMAGLYLNGKIDDEILALGNQHDFPVISLDNNLRWSDVIREFYSFRQPKYEVPNTNAKDIYRVFSVVDDYHVHKRIDQLCSDVSGSIGLPVLILAHGEVYASLMDLPASFKDKAVNKINSIWSDTHLTQDTPVNLYMNENTNIFCLFGQDSAFAAVIKKNEYQNKYLDILQGVAEFIVSQVDKNHSKKADALGPEQIDDTTQYYYFYLRKEAIEDTVDALKESCLLLDLSEKFNYAVCLIEQEKIDENQLCAEYSKIMGRAQPNCFIFSEMSATLGQIRPLIGMLTSQLNSMYSLNGMFTFGEISLLYILNIVPYSLKKPIIEYYSNTLNYQESPLFLDTLRLFIVLKSINKVSDLMDVHPNTVKYRILKAINYKFLDTTNITTNVWTLDFLIPLENLKLERVVQQEEDAAR